MLRIFIRKSIKRTCLDASRKSTVGLKFHTNFYGRYPTTSQNVSPTNFYESIKSYSTYVPKNVKTNVQKNVTTDRLRTPVMHGYEYKNEVLNKWIYECGAREYEFRVCKNVNTNHLKVYIEERYKNKNKYTIILLDSMSCAEKLLEILEKINDLVEKNSGDFSSIPPSEIIYGEKFSGVEILYKVIFMKGRQQEKPLNFISFSSENLRKNNKKDTIYFDQNRLGNFVQLLKEILNNYGSKSKEGRITANQHHESEISSKANDKDSKEKIEPKFHEYVPLGKPKFFECDERTIKIALVRTNKDMRRFVKIKQSNKWNDISNTYHIDVVTAGTLLKSLEAIKEIISKFKENAKNDVFSSVNPKEKLYTCKFSDSMKNYYVTLEVGNLQGHHKHAFYIWIRDEKLDSSVKAYPLCISDVLITDVKQHIEELVKNQSLNLKNQFKMKS